MPTIYRTQSPGKKKWFSILFLLYVIRETYEIKPIKLVAVNDNL